MSWSNKMFKMLFIKRKLHLSTRTRCSHLRCNPSTLYIWGHNKENLFLRLLSKKKNVCHSYFLWKNVSPSSVVWTRGPFANTKIIKKLRSSRFEICGHVIMSFVTEIILRSAIKWSKNLTIFLWMCLLEINWGQCRKITWTVTQTSIYYMYTIRLDKTF